jgi:hypothetical protein
MASLNSNKIIPFIIICFCLLIFIGILRNKKAEKINNIMENFINNEKFINKNIEHFNNEKLIINHSLDKNFIHQYMNGLWTTPGTTLNKEGFANELMEIKLIGKKGYIELPKVPKNNYFNGLKYNIILVTGMSIVATSKESQYTLSINTVDISKDKNYGKDGLLLTTNVPLAKLIFTDKNNNILLNIYSYKVPEHRKIEPGQLKDIIESKNFNGNEIKNIYDIPSYIKIIGGDYNFLRDSISFSYGINYNTSTEIKNYYNIITDKYGGNLSFRIAYIFTPQDGSNIKTRASEIYTLSAIKTIGNNKKIIQIPDKIIIKAPNKSIVANKINIKEYIPKSIIIYFYKATNTSINYSFADSAKINTGIFKFDNNSSSMFSTNKVDTNDLNTLTKNINTQNTITSFRTIFTPDINKDISIPFLDLCQLL